MCGEDFVDSVNFVCDFRHCVLGIDTGGILWYNITMRVWDESLLPYLDNTRVNAQHHEIHCIDSINRHHLKGFYNHPETRRWRGHRIALALMHQITRDEMAKRGIEHTQKETSDLHEFIDMLGHDELMNCTVPGNWQPVGEQKELLKWKQQKLQS